MVRSSRVEIVWLNECVFIPLGRGTAEISHLSQSASLSDGEFLSAEKRGAAGVIKFQTRKLNGNPSELYNVYILS